MVDMAIYMDKAPANSPAEKRENMPMSDTTEKPLTAIVREQHKIIDTPDDEPIKKIHHAMAARLDRFESILAKMGPDNSKHFGEIFEREAKRSLYNVSKLFLPEVGLIRLGVLISIVATSVGLTWFITSSQNQPSPIGPVPPGMARSMHMQNWPEQFESCIEQPPRNGFEWCLMPYIKSTPNIKRIKG